MRTESTNKMRISLSTSGFRPTVCGFSLRLRILKQLNLNIRMPYYVFVDSLNCSGFRKDSCGFHKFAYFRSNYERYSVLGICLWNSKQKKSSKK